MLELSIKRLFRFIDGTVAPFSGVKDVRLPDGLAKCIVYMFPDKVAAEDGDGSSAATAFWVGVKTDNRTRAFLVTNAHVIDAGATVARWLLEDGKAHIAVTNENAWFRHQDRNIDLAIYEVTGNLFACDILMPLQTFVAQDELSSLDVRLGDDVCMVGLHRRHNDSITDTPTARFGHLIQFPGEKILDDRGREQYAYLLQIPSLPGFSGSPVFLIQDEAEKDKERQMIIFQQGQHGRQIRLLGINCGHLPAYYPTYRTDSGMLNDTLKSESNSGVIYATLAWNLYDLINLYLRHEKSRR